MRKLNSTRLILLFLSAMLADACAQGTAFTYQGRLNQNGVPTTGIFDLRFTAYNAPAAPTPASAAITLTSVSVTNGLFTVALDFGAGLFTGPQRWLEIEVRTNGAGSFVVLAPRQLVTPVPYATHAATASNVVSGAAVKSLNNLRDDVSLLAGANVTLTPIGNSITIASTGGGGGSGPWALNGASAYYNGGRVGVGTTTPVSRLTVSGAGVFDSPLAAAITLENTAAGRRWEWHALDDGRMQLADFTAGASRMMFNVNGHVGIDTITPTSKLTVYTPLVASGVEHTDGNIRLSTYLDASGGWLGTLSNHKLQFFVNNGGPSMAISTAGNVGVGTTTPAAKLDVAGNVAISGNLGIGTATPADRLYIAGEAASGFAIGIEGNARQNLDKGGWVKAMAYVNGDGMVIRSFNPFATTTVTKPFPGYYLVNFGFPTNGRFVSVAAKDGRGNAGAENVGANFSMGGEGGGAPVPINSVRVITFDTDQPIASRDCPFMIIVY